MFLYYFLEGYDMKKKMFTILCVLVIALSMTTPAYAAKKDTKAPTVTGTNPEEKATNIMIEDRIVVRFSEKVKKGKTIDQMILKGSGLDASDYTYELKDNLLTVIPKKKLNYNREYSLSIPAGAVKDAAGNGLKEAFNLSFITEEDPAAMKAADPAQMNYRLEVEAELQGEFTENMKSYLVQYLKMFGINANITKVEKITKEAE
jgi:methionine-rich copper-binding protein CopC